MYTQYLTYYLPYVSWEKIFIICFSAPPPLHKFYQQRIIFGVLGQYYKSLYSVCVLYSFFQLLKVRPGTDLYLGLQYAKKQEICKLVLAGTPTSYFLIIISLHPDVISKNLTRERLVKPSIRFSFQRVPENPRIQLYLFCSLYVMAK